MPGSPESKRRRERLPYIAPFKHEPNLLDLDALVVVEGHYDWKAVARAVNAQVGGAEKMTSCHCDGGWKGKSQSNVANPCLTWHHSVQSGPRDCQNTCENRDFFKMLWCGVLLRLLHNL